MSIQFMTGPKTTNIGLVLMDKLAPGEMPHVPSGETELILKRDTFELARFAAKADVTEEGVGIVGEPLTESTYN